MASNAKRSAVRYRWVIGVVLLGGVLLVGRNLGQHERFAELLGSARPEWILALVGLQLATYLLLARAWTIAIRQASGTPPGYWTLVRLSLAELFTDQALPSAGIGGTVFVVRSLVRRGVPSAAASAAVVASLFGLYAAQIVAVGAATVLFAIRHRLVHFVLLAVGLALVASLAVPAGAFAIAAGALPRLPQRVQRLRFVRAVRESIASAPRDVVFAPRTLVPVALLRLGIIAIDGGTLTVAAAAFGHPIPVVDAMAVFVVASVAGSLSFIPGALGTFEILAIGLLSLLGVSIEVGVSSIVLMRGFSFWLPMPPGLWFAHRELRP